MALNKPKSKHHKEHGVPEPATKITDADRLMVGTLMEEPNKVFIYYIRKKPEVAVKRDKDGNHKGYQLVRSAPVGALVAFCSSDKPEEVMIGWSRRNSSLVKKTLKGGKVIKISVEPLPFTKRDAVYVAILRGLTDSVEFRVSKKNAKTSEGIHIPNDVMRQLPRFAERVGMYFGSECTVKNVVFSEED